MLHVIKPSEIESVVGKEVGTSDWITIDQERIDKFADATLDNQFIHVNPEQAEPISVSYTHLTLPTTPYV